MGAFKNLMIDEMNKEREAQLWELNEEIYKDYLVVKRGSGEDLVRWNLNGENWYAWCTGRPAYQTVWEGEARAIHLGWID